MFKTLWHSKQWHICKCSPFSNHSTATHAFLFALISISRKCHELVSGTSWHRTSQQTSLVLAIYNSIKKRQKKNILQTSKNVTRRGRNIRVQQKRSMDHVRKTVDKHGGRLKRKKAEQESHQTSLIELLFSSSSISSQVPVRSGRRQPVSRVRRCQ